MDWAAGQTDRQSRSLRIRLIRPRSSRAILSGEKMKIEYFRKSRKLRRGVFTKLELQPLVESLPGRRVIAKGKKVLGSLLCRLFSPKCSENGLGRRTDRPNDLSLLPRPRPRLYPRPLPPLSSGRSIVLGSRD